MEHAATPQQTMISMIVTFAIIGIVLFFRLRRMSQLRPLKLEQLWIVPAIYLLAVGWLFYRGTPDPTGWAICGATLIVGGVLGWQRGRMMQISIDPETHTLNQKSSVAGMLFIVGLILVKTVAQVEESQLHLNLALVAQAFGAFGLGLFTLTRVEMYLRAKRLLEQAGKA
jgi:hypothetical protein